MTDIPQVRGRDAALECDRALDRLAGDEALKTEIRTAFLVAFEIGEPMFFFKERKKAKIMAELFAIEFALFEAACEKQFALMRDEGRLSDEECAAAQLALRTCINARNDRVPSLRAYLAAGKIAREKGTDPGKSVLEEARGQVLRAGLGASVPMGGLFAIFAEGAGKTAQSHAEAFAAELFRA